MKWKSKEAAGCFIIITSAILGLLLLGACTSACSLELSRSEAEKVAWETLQPYTSARTLELSRSEAEKVAWETLQPYTSSHERANWTIKEIKIVGGDALPDAFQKERSDTCFQFSSAPPPPEAIRPDAKYWLVEFAPLPSTARSTPLSPTAPPHIPEPFLRQAFILIDAATGKMGAIRLSCVIY